MIRREGIMVQLFTNRCGRSMTRQQPIFKRQSKDLSSDRVEMVLIQRTGIRAPNRSREQRITDEAHALWLGLHTIANPAGGMTRRRQAVYPQAPDRDGTSVVRGS